MGRGLAQRQVIVGVSHDLRGDSWGCVSRSLFWREDPDGDGERGFDCLTFALVSSKTHREGCRASQLFLDENKLDKKSFKDKVPLHPEMDPLYDQVATEHEQTLVGPSLPPHPEANKKLKILGKRKVASGIPGKALPSKDKAYAELERKCNEALHLDKNPLVSNMRAEIKVLQGQVDGLHSIESERERLKSSEIQLLQEIDSLKQDRASVVSKVILNTAMKLVRSDDLGVLIAKLVRSSIIYGRCQAFEEVVAIKEPFVLDKMSGYRPSSKKEYDQAGDALENASYPF
nr:hypothetical protein [Tanacetum cinerariifolium]